MDFAPLNTRMAVPGALDAAQMQNNLNQSINTQQNFITKEQMQLAQMKENQVNEREYEDGAKVKDEGHGGGYEGQQKKKDDDDGEEKDKNPLAFDTVRGRFLDISM